MSSSHSPFLRLPSLVRDEVLSHLLPSSNAIWIIRPAGSTGGWNLPAVALAEQYFEYYNAFWRRRQFEHRSLAHWYPGASWGLNEDGAGFHSAEAVAERLDARTFLSLRLVCRMLCVEVSALLFRRVTLCWSVWNSADARLLREQIDEQAKWEGSRNSIAAAGEEEGEAAARDGMVQETGAAAKRRLSPQWQDGYGSPTLLEWMARFRKTRIFVQEGFLGELFEGLDEMLRTSSRPLLGLRLPQIQIVICGFKLVFDHGELSWQAYLPDDDFAKKILQFKRGQAKEGGVKPSEGKLLVEGLEGSGECEFWSDEEKSYWLEAFEFCNKPFTAKATFGDDRVDISGSLVFYTYKKGMGEDEEKTEGPTRSEGDAVVTSD